MLKTKSIIYVLGYYLVIVVRHLEDDVIVDVDVEDVVVFLPLEKSFSVRQIALAALVRVSDHVPDFAPFASCCFFGEKKSFNI